MPTVVYINCSSAPYIDLIMRREKLDETRTRNMLRAVVGRRVYLAETGHGRPAVVRCSAVIQDPDVVTTREQWDRLRPFHRVPANSKYDWKPETTKKYLYPVVDVVPCKPFTPPDGVRHGYVYMDYTDNNTEV